MKIVVLDGYTENPGDLSWEGLEALGTLTVYDRTPGDKVIERIADAQAVYTNKTPITGETIEKCANMKFIGVLATGYNVIDIKAARSANVVVSNIPSYGTDAVAQYAVALLLELCHHIGEHSDCVKAGGWSRSRDWCFWKHPLVELAGKTFGVIGFGRIGQRTAKIAEALGMKIVAYDERPVKELEGENFRYVSLDELLSMSDAKMKDGVKIINTSRGPLIVEQDLRQALDSGKVSGAAVDVVSEEPIREDNPLLGAKNSIITPHIAWAPRESRQRLMDIAVSNLKAFMEGNPVNVVS